MADLFKQTASTDKDKRELGKVVAHWLNEIEEAQKREKDFRKEAQRCVNIFEAKSDGENQAQAYNILYANVETLSPALYNSVPRPEVKRRFAKDKESPVNALAAKVLQNTLSFLVNTDQDGYSSFDDLQKSAVQESLVPGRGLTRFKYAPTFSKEDEVETVSAETVCGEEVSWDRFQIGYAKVWADVPWVAFEHFFTREELQNHFGKEVADKVKLTSVPADSSDKDNKMPADSAGVQFAHVWEIWDKDEKKVLFISEGHPDPIKEVEDPLKLVGFFPLPKPMIFLNKISSMVPKPLYLMYEEQAKELNNITVRIGALTKALKVRGFYDSTISGMDTLLSKGDNTLLPATGVAALQQGSSLEKSIWLMPLEKIITTLQQLYVNRQQVKQVIYEITGIADILRGSSQASETLGAQKIKEAWGTLRLKRMQKEVMRYSRESLRIMAELASNNFSWKTFAEMSGVELPTAEIKLQAQMQIQQLQQQQAMGAQVDPQMLAQVQGVLASPTWEDVLAVLRNDVTRNFIIRIETNSTIDAEATDDKAHVTEFMNAMGQLLGGLVPMVEKGFLPFEVAKGMMLAVTQKFQFGAEVEDLLKKMAPPAPKTGADPKAAAEAAAIQADMQHQQQIRQMEMAAVQEEQKVKQLEHQAKAQEIQQKMQLAAAKFQADMAILNMKVKTARISAEAAEGTAEATARKNAAAVKAAEAPKPAPATGGS